MIKQVWLKIVITIVVTALVAFNILLITGFTSENAEKSTETSTAFVKDVLTVVYPDFTDKTEPEQTEIVEKYEPPTRKIAHFTEFALLGGSYIHALTIISELWSNDERKNKLFPWKYCGVWSVVLGIIVGVCDELRQISVPGRSCEIKDMLIDSLGVIIGACVMVLVRMLFLKIRMRCQLRHKT